MLGEVGLLTPRRHVSKLKLQIATLTQPRRRRRRKTQRRLVLQQLRLRRRHSPSLHTLRVRLTYGAAGAATAPAAPAVAPDTLCTIERNSGDMHRRPRLPQRHRYHHRQQPQQRQSDHRRSSAAPAHTARPRLRVCARRRLDPRPTRRSSARTRHQVEVGRSGATCFQVEVGRRQGRNYRRRQEARQLQLAPPRHGRGPGQLQLVFDWMSTRCCPAG